MVPQALCAVLAVIVAIVLLAVLVSGLIERATSMDDPADKQALIKKTAVDNSEQSPPHDPADFLVLITATCSGYFDWQALAAYDAAKRVWPEAEIVRLLHCPDSDRSGYKYFDIMPSVYTSDCSKHPRYDDSYAPLNRPVALVEFFEKFKPEDLKQTYVVIMDSDTLLRRRMNHVKVSEGKPVGQDASILVPKMYTAATAIFGKAVTDDTVRALPLYDFGSPYILHKNDAAKIAPLWRLHTNMLRENPESKNTIGWICEMYSYITACAELGLHTTVRNDLQSRWPYTDNKTDYCSYHYDQDHEHEGKKWSKRQFMSDLLAKDVTTLMPADFAPNEHMKNIIGSINTSLTDWRGKEQSAPPAT